MSPIATGGPPHTRATSVNGVGPTNTVNGYAKAGIGGNKGARASFRHLDDLTSVKPDVDLNWPIRKLLRDAEILAKQADTHIDFRRPDIALEEYIKAFTLAANYIPHHKDFPSLASSQTELHRSYMGLLKRLKAQQPRFENAKQQIKEDNQKSGVLALSGGSEKAVPKSVTDSVSNGKHANGILANGVPRKKPPVQPKPDALHGKALSLSSTPTMAVDSDLSTRFARLRSPPVQDPRIRTQPISIPEDGKPAKPVISSSTILRPLGPREMPAAPTAAPAQVRLPLDVHIPEMPKPPDAIYSPSRNPDSAATINFPTSIPRSSSYIGSGNVAAPPVSTVRTPSLEVRQDIFSSAHKIVENGIHRRDFVISDSATVSASELTEYIRMGSQKMRILLVDVRSREHFDEGHIMSSSVICIEPISLREGISSEELMDGLILSPESELRLFERRHEFDLVVFYDQYSSSYRGNSRQGDANYLENFSKAMFEYGYEKSSKRRPKLLLGGLDAWADLMGPSSLQSSSTFSKSINGKASRPLGRVTVARGPNRFPARRKNFESRPLSKEDESKWDETLKEHTTHEDATVEQPQFDELSYARTTEDFFRRYPELPTVQESMISARSAPKRYQMGPINSVPLPPARPAPTLPRQRSSGVLETIPSADYTMTSTAGITNSGPPPGLCGLKNHGVTCYTNAVIQCLSASDQLRDFLRTFNPGLRTSVPKKTGEVTDPPQLLVRNLGNLLGHMWSGQYDYVAPTTFLGYVNDIHIALMPPRSLKRHAFGGEGRQHDAAEFLMFIIGVLHDELNRKRDQPDYQAQVNLLSDEQVRATDLLDNRLAIRQERKRKLASDDSAFSNNFHGMDAQLIKCTQSDCGFTTKRFREFTVLQMNFPNKYLVPGAPSTVKLTEIFRSIFNSAEPDLLSEYFCSECKRKSSGRIDRAVTYLPDYLILEFERFQQDQYDPTFPNRPPVTRKLSTRIEFTETIDLKPIFIPVDPPASLPGDKSDVRGCIEPFIYDCYGIIMHLGRDIQSGHYIAMTRNLDKPKPGWHEFNDISVTPQKFAFSQRQNVTHIFLKRRKT